MYTIKKFQVLIDKNVYVVSILFDVNLRKIESRLEKLIVSLRVRVKQHSLIRRKYDLFQQIHKHNDENWWLKSVNTCHSVAEHSAFA